MSIYEINYQEIENEILNIPFPILYIDCLLNIQLNKIDHMSQDLCDEILSIKLRFFLKYHSNIATENNLNDYNKYLKNYPLTKNIIKDYYYNVSNQIDIIKRLQKWKLIYNNKIFWSKSIESQTLHLKNLRNSFLSIYDGRIGNIYFHLRIKGSDENTNIIDEMIDRLHQIYKLFKYNFFYQSGTILLLHEDFMDLTYEKRVEYVEYIFNKIKKILDYYILSFELYELYRSQLDTLLNPIPPLHIDIFNVYSDIENEDIDFIICK